MNYHVLQCEIFIDEGEPVDVEGRYYPGMRGQRDRYGVPLTPDDDPEIEFIRATRDGVEVELTDEQREQAEAELWDQDLGTPY